AAGPLPGERCLFFSVSNARNEHNTERPMSASLALDRSAQLYSRVRRVIPPIEWPAFVDDIDAILALKRERNAVVLAHNYMTPEIFHCVADITGDSLALAREAQNVRADVIVMA